MGFIPALKRVAADHGKKIFLGGFIMILIGLVFNAIGLSTHKWLMVEPPNLFLVYCGPYFDKSNQNILDHFCGSDIDYAIPTGSFITVLGEIVLVIFLFKGMKKVWLLRIGGFAVLVGGILTNVAVIVWLYSLYGPPEFKPYSFFGYGFILSLTGAALHQVSGIVLLVLSKLTDFSNPYSNV